MAEHLVVDVNAEFGLVALRDRMRAYHVALITAERPVAGQHIHGSHAALGLNLMSNPVSGQLY